jgi:Bacteriocin-protection, YdeI or OmpD-Associated
VAVSRSYIATVVMADDGTVRVPVPFDPDEVWGAKARHSIAGTVAGIPVRGDVRPVGDGHEFVLGPAWLRGRGPDLGVQVQVVIEAEGPQRADLADDVAAALDADPKAGESFDALAQFYRKAFLGWIDATRRRPEQRPIRITEMVELLKAGKKQRP